RGPGVPDPVWRVAVLAGIPSLRRRSHGRARVRSIARWRARRILPGHAGDLPARFHPRLHRDHLRGGADRRPGTAGHGTGPYLAGRDDRAEPADLLPDATIRIRALLPAWRHAPIGADQYHLQRRGALHPAADIAAGDCVSVSGADHLAA